MSENPVMQVAPSDAPFPSVELNRCPFPFYDERREATPIEQVPGGYRIYRHEDIAFVLQNEDWFSAYIPGNQTSKGIDWEGAVHIGADDGDRHDQNRKLLSRPFTPKRLKTYEPMIEQHSDHLIDRFIDRGSVEFAGEFADRLPAMVISDMLGLPVEGEELEFLRTWNAAFTSGQPAPEEFTRMHDHILANLTERRENPRDDVMSELIERQVERDGEYDPGLCSTLAIEMISGGVITTGELITSAMMLLIQHPDEMAAVRADYGRIIPMLEETLRLEAPVQFRQRVAQVDVEVAGVEIPAGSMVWLMLQSGSRDDGTFECPADFKVGRENIKRHFGFGLGLHFCVGAPLARLEGRIAFERLLSRVQDIRFAPGNDFRNIDSPVFRMPQRLEIEFEA